MDTQTLAGLEVALPARACGVDIIAYVDINPAGTRFVAGPIRRTDPDEGGVAALVRHLEEVREDPRSCPRVRLARGRDERARIESAQRVRLGATAEGAWSGGRGLR